MSRPDPHNEAAGSRPQLDASASRSQLALRQSHALAHPWDRASEGDDDEGLTLSDLLHIVYKHKWTLIVVAALAVAVAAVNTFLTRPVYRATTVLQIEKPARVMEFQNVNTIDLDALSPDDSVALKTQYELLRSRSLVERVIDEMGLDKTRPGALANAGQRGASAAGAANPAPSSNPVTGFVDRVLAGYRRLSTPSTSDPAVLSREGVIGAFQGALSVDPVVSSRLVRLSVENVDPALAARIANTTAGIFITSNQDRRAESGAYAKNFLEDQIKQVKARLEESERRLNQFAQSKQILTLDEKTNVLNQTFTDYAAALGRAEQERIKAEATYQELKRNPEAVGTMPESRGGAGQSTLSIHKDQKAKLEQEYQTNLRIYKPDFPKMQQLRVQIQEVDSQLKAELNNILAGAKASYEAALSQEAQLRERLGRTRKEVLTGQDNSIDLNLLRREVETNRQLYDGLLQRLKQVGVVSGQAQNTVSIVDPAVPPLFPYKPNLRSNMMGGLAVGLFLGLCLVFLLEYRDDSIKDPADVERVLGVALMGVVPLHRRKRGESEDVAMQVHSDPRSTLAEAYRSVRTALQFATVEGAPRHLLVSSTTRDEGKSTTALALAINFAQMGKPVLLIDADMRNPSVHKLVRLPNETGLSNLLSTDAPVQAFVQATLVPHLSVMTAGPPPPNPVDLLLGPKFHRFLQRASELGYRHVIIDGPPVLGIADAIVLGNHIQEILFVMRHASTHKSNARDALRRLRQAGLYPRGVVFTQVSSRGVSYDYTSYYGYDAPAERPRRSQGAARRDPA